MSYHLFEFNGLFYYISIIICFLAMYRSIIRDIIFVKQLLIFRDLVLIISLSILIFIPVLNFAMAFIMFTHGFLQGLDMYEHKVIFKFNKNK